MCFLMYMRSITFLPCYLRLFSPWWFFRFCVPIVQNWIRLFVLVVSDLSMCFCLWFCNWNINGHPTPFCFLLVFLWHQRFDKKNWLFFFCPPLSKVVEWLSGCMPFVPMHELAWCYWAGLWTSKHLIRTEGSASKPNSCMQLN